MPVIKTQPSTELHPPHPTTYRQIEICGEAVDLQWLPTRLLDDCYGKCVTEQREIQLRDNLDGLQCLDTTLHEIFHYASDKANLELSEHQVHVLGMIWAQIYMANPELLGFIAERCEEEAARRINNSNNN